MSTVKEEAKRLIEHLPEHVTWDDIMYEIYVRQKIDLGLKAAAAGNVVPHEDVKRMFTQQ